jgi:hypothetical protein
MSLETYLPRKRVNIKGKGNRGARERRSKWTTETSDSRIDNYLGKPSGIWDLGFRFNEDVYNEIRDSRFGVLVPFLGAFDLDGLGTQKNRPPKPKTEGKKQTFNESKKGPKSDKKTEYIYIPRLYCVGLSPCCLPIALSVSPAATLCLTITLPCHPKTYYLHLTQSAIAFKYKGFAKGLLGLDQMVYNAHPSKRKAKRSKRLPSLKDSKAFEVTTAESECYVDELRYKEPKKAGKKTTSLNAFLKSTPFVEFVHGARSKGQKNGEVFRFNCKKLQKYDVWIDPKWLDEIQAKRDKMFDKRKKDKGWESYVRCNQEYRLSDESLEELRTLEIEKDGEIKTYEREHDTIKNGTYPLKQRSGSYYCEHNNIPDVVRVQRQNAKGESLPICDQSSAHGYFLHVLLRQLIEFIEKRDGKTFTEARKALDRMGNDLESRKLYEYIPKKGFVAFLNAKYGAWTTPYIKDAFHAFEERYKALYPFFLGLKNQHDHQLYRPITHLQTIMMEECRDQCLEWGFDAQIHGDELGAPEPEIMRVKDLMLEKIHEHTGIAGWVKVTIHGKEDQRFQYQPKDAHQDDPNPIDGRCEIEGESYEVCSINIEGLAPEIIERMQQLLKTVRTPAKFTKERLFVPIPKGHSTENLLNNVISNRTKSDVRPSEIKATCPGDLCPDCWSDNKAMLIASSFPCKHLKGNVTSFPIHPKGETESDAG